MNLNLFDSDHEFLGEPGYNPDSDRIVY